MMLSKLNVMQKISKETKRRDIISRSTSNNSSQAQEFYLPDVLLTGRVENECSWKKKKAELLIMELGVQNSQFCQWFWNILEDLAPY